MITDLFIDAIVFNRRRWPWDFVRIMWVDQWRHSPKTKGFSSEPAAILRTPLRFSVKCKKKNTDSDKNPKSSRLTGDDPRSYPQPPRSWAAPETRASTHRFSVVAKLTII